MVNVGRARLSLLRTLASRWIKLQGIGESNGNMPTKRTAHTTYRRKKQSQQHQWTPENIRALRRHLGLSQTQFTEEIGILQQTVSICECGYHRPKGASITILNLLADKAKFKFEADRKEESRAD